MIRRLRTQCGLSVLGLAEQAGISAPFLGAVERGESGIALRRLAQVAGLLDHDVASLLGYSRRRNDSDESGVAAGFATETVY